MDEGVLLSTAYCGPVHYFEMVANPSRVFIEQHENFIRQTYRNRCVILGSNGPLSLVIPVEKGRKPGLKIRDVRIAWYEKWQQNHWRSIYSAYNNSPYFDYFADDIRRFYTDRWRFLFDFNMEFLEKILELLLPEVKIMLTQGFEEVPGRFVNCRETLTPKITTPCNGYGIRAVPYTQVFEEKFPFVSGLSILDLLFNTGPEAGDILRHSG